MENSLEHKKTAREILVDLENANVYTFHGSPLKLEKLDPQQAYNYPTPDDDSKIPDGDPAVFTSPVVDIAIFMALINKKNLPYSRSGFSFNTKNGKEIFKEFRIDHKTAENMKTLKGYVYVFPKKDFIQRGGVELISYTSKIPEMVIEVTEHDLPKEIIVKDF